MNRLWVVAMAALCAGPVCRAQSLFHMPPAKNPVPVAPSAPGNGQGGGVGGAGAPADPSPAPVAAQAAMPTLDQVGLFVVTPVAPKKWAQHDKVEIIINETSITKFEQSLDAKKNYDFAAELSQFPSLEAFFSDLIYKPGVTSNTPKVGLTGNSKFKGDGTYERKENMTARISGLVLDVKPNGLLVVEARESVQSDEETKTMVLSGVVDPKDITTTGSVQSAQMANLTIKVEHEGQVKKTGTKGLIPRIFETVFNF